MDKSRKTDFELRVFFNGHEHQHGVKRAKKTLEMALSASQIKTLFDFHDNLSRLKPTEVGQMIVSVQATGLTLVNSR